ncbi:MAG: hypothetical protein Q9182_004945 [Xanthomendoza sp. 2 TL-2023]
MASNIVAPEPPTSPRPPETPPGSPACTPLDSPRVHEFLQLGTIDRFEHGVERLVRALEKVDARNEPDDVRLEATKHVEAEKPKIRASKLEYKLIDEVTSKYKIVDSAALPEEVTDLDEYMFVVRARTEKGASEQVFYVDFKSNALRDVLRIVLRDVHGLSLGEDKITLERNLLYHYIPELEAHGTELEDDTDSEAKLKHLNLLVEYIRAAYISTSSRLASLLENREITYDLLWALFKPNMEVYTTVLDAEKPACCRYDSGKERTTTTGIVYFHVECRLLDSHGQVFGEVSTALGIGKFPGAKRIDRLEAFALEFHAHQQEMREYFVRCGRQFASLMGQHHVQYRGNAFYIEKGEYVEVPVDSRIMVDVAYFRKINPNYPRPHINELARPISSNNTYVLFFSDTEAEGVKTNGLDTTTMSEGNLMICSQTVYGWSFGHNRWLDDITEFVVDDITEIVWNPSSFDNLAILATKKKVITALAKAHMSRVSDDVIDDFVEGKGQGLITLLQYEFWRLVLSHRLTLYFQWSPSSDRDVKGNFIANVTHLWPLTSELELLGTPHSLQTGWIAEPLTCSYLSDFPVWLVPELSRQDEWRAALEERSLSTCIDNEQDPALQVVLSNNKYEILDESGREIINLPAMPQDQTDTSRVCNVLEHLARFRMAKDEINKMPRAAFRESLDVQIRANRKASNLEEQIEVQHGNIVELVMKNAGDTAIYVYVYNLGPLWQVKGMSYEVIPERNHDGDLKFIGISSKKIKMTVPPAMSGYGSCEDIIKVFVTSQPTSFDSLELPNLDELGKTNVGDKTNRPNSHESGDWVALNFPTRTLL